MRKGLLVISGVIAVASIAIFVWLKTQSNRKSDVRQFFSQVSRSRILSERDINFFIEAYPYIKAKLKEKAIGVPLNSLIEIHKVYLSVEKELKDDEKFKAFLNKYKINNSREVFNIIYHILSTYSLVNIENRYGSIDNFEKELKKIQGENEKVTKFIEQIKVVKKETPSANIQLVKENFDKIQQIVVVTTGSN